MSQIRTLAFKTKGVATSDGAGVKIRRLLGHRELQMLDPFLMLDHFHSDNPGDYIAGFPPHPHRGFETVTYMFAGRLRHKDNKGHEGVIEPGGVQWMTAAGGIEHSEMPEQEDGLMSGFQLWINLPREKKMDPARYQEFDPARIPEDVRETGAKARIVTGKTSTGIEGPVRDVATDPFYADVRLESGGVYEEPVDPGKTVMIAVRDGALNFDDADGKAVTLSAGELGVLMTGDTVRLEAGSDGATALFLAGRPIREPVAWGGPFVMNTEGEVRQAMLDYQAGRF